MRKLEKYQIDALKNDIIRKSGARNRKKQTGDISLEKIYKDLHKNIIQEITKEEIQSKIEIFYNIQDVITRDANALDNAKHLDREILLDKNLDIRTWLTNNNYCINPFSWTNRQHVRFKLRWGFNWV